MVAFRLARRSLAPLVRVLTVFLLSLPFAAHAYDTDQDGVEDHLDNCLIVANANQIDVDADGYGNVCDGDFDNSSATNFIDYALLVARFFQGAPYDDAFGERADMNNDGIINFLDIGLFSQAFGKPPGPSGNDTLFSESEAARFLTQSTFGARLTEIQALASESDFESWLDAQFNVPNSSHEILTRVLALQMCFDTPAITDLDGYYQQPRQTAWWTIVLQGSDQLRQRVAFALSQILVASDRTEMLAGSQYAMANYYDMLGEHAFGNYRDLMEAVTKHAVMGIYLSMVRNEKAQPSLNIRPDENYARELLQLFSIGVHELNLDGSKKLDTNGSPIPTYDQDDIEQFARVFTGWNYAGINWWEWFAQSDRTQPMEAWAEYHDTDPKTLLGGAQVPGGQTAQQDLEAALDNIFVHPNVGPYVSRLLIQRMVTSNPTPAYIERVAAVFNNNGSGVRGDLAAVVKTILLDAEARYGHTYLGDTFGKLREPLLRLSQVRRSFNAIPPVRSGYYWDSSVQCGQPAYAAYPSPFGNTSQSLQQQAQNAPSVFNFYSPDYAPPGPVRIGGLYAPEFQLFNASAAQSTAKAISFEVQNNQIWGPDWIELNLAAEIALASDPDTLMNHLDVLLVNGQLSALTRADIVAHLNDPSLPTDASLNEVRVRDAIMLTVLSPDYLIQR